MRSSSDISAAVSSNAVLSREVEHGEAVGEGSDLLDAVVLLEADQLHAWYGSERKECLEWGRAKTIAG